MSDSDDESHSANEIVKESPTSQHIMTWHAKELNHTISGDRVKDVCEIIAKYYSRGDFLTAQEFLKGILEYNFIMGVFSEVIDPVDS